jgi:hypothetical protein
MLGPIHDMMTCSFDKLPIEMPLNPFYTMLGYHGFDNYLKCCQRHKVRTMTASLSCYNPFYTNCPKYGNPDKTNQCYDALQRLRINQTSAVKMLNDTKSSPIEKSVAKFYKCMSQIYNKIKPCMSELTTSCKAAKLRAAKEVWTDMRLVLSLLRRGTGFKVVHLIRDPRGMLVSRERYDKGHMINKQHVLETCTRLSTDVATYKQLAAEFPGDSIQIRYEDLVQWPKKVATQVYTMVGLDESTLQQYLNKWMRKISGPPKKGLSSFFSTSRKNMSAEAYDWMKLMPLEHRLLIESIPMCANIIKALKYPAILRV